MSSVHGPRLFIPSLYINVAASMNRRTATVIRSGPSSLVVVIPKDWARGMEIEAGDEVTMLYDGEVTIRKISKEGSDG
jgi:AbrB family looped-hinge helix DNA binding protein